MNQFEITTSIIRNWGKYDLSESAKVLMATLSTHYPIIKLFNTTLMKETGLSESTFYRALKELKNKSFILTDKKEFTLNLTENIFHFDCKTTSKVVNLTDACINKNKNNNKYIYNQPKEIKSASFEKKTKEQLYGEF